MILRLVSILLLAAMLFKPIMGLMIVIDYQINKDYIATYLCENLDRPELECEGKCYLMTTLRNRMNESADHKSKQLTQISKIEVLDLPQTSKITFVNAFELLRDKGARHAISSGFPRSVFQPPTAA